MALLCRCTPDDLLSRVPAPLETCLETVSAEPMEREDSQLPLLMHGHPAPSSMKLDHVASEYGGVGSADLLGPEHDRVLGKAVGLFSQQVQIIRSSRYTLSRMETSELVRDTCQSLLEMTEVLEHAWRNAHPSDPMPVWPTNVIPEEELARIGWDFHANRVQMVRNTGQSLLDSIGFFFRGDQQASFAKAPTPAAVAEAFSRASQRLASEVKSFNHRPSMIRV